MPELVVMAVCLILNGILSGLEMAFVSVGKPRLRELARQGNRDAQKILNLKENPERTLSVLQVGITLVGVLAAAVGGAGAEEALSPLLEGRLALSENVAESISILAVALPYTYLSVVVGELVPKSFALKNPLSIILRGSRWLVVTDKIFSPLVTILEWSTKTILRLFIRGPKEGPPEISPLGEPFDIENLPSDHRQYVMNLVNIRNKKVRDVLVPWPQVISVDISQQTQEIASIAFSSGHTRLPVLRDGSVIGILHTKEFIALSSTGTDSWETAIRPVVQVQEGDSLIQALKLMQARRSHLSIVFSGSAKAGIVTMEDIFEEVVGEIYDEDDDGRLRRILAARRDRLKEWVKPSVASGSASGAPPSSEQRPVVLPGDQTKTH